MGMTGISRTARVVVALAAVTLAACGRTGGTAAGGPPSEPAVADSVADAVGRTYVSTGVTVKGEPRPLVEGSRIRLALDEGSVGADAGCNHLGGTYEMDGDRLVVAGLAGTEMGCDPAALMDQDSWLANLLTAGPVVAVEGDRLTLTSGDTVVSMVDVESAEPDRPLRGTRWVLESYGGSKPDDTVSSVPAGVRSTLRLDGLRAWVSPGCNDGSARYTLGGSTLRLEDIAITRAGCLDEPGDVEGAVLTVLRAGVTWRIDGDVLTLTSPAGTLTYRAQD
jgi:heat shock protein HslJ